mgnify:CR=1 FL=1
MVHRLKRDRLGYIIRTLSADGRWDAVRSEYGDMGLHFMRGVGRVNISEGLTVGPL